jgi:glycosyltransferase involved in cell wall biosynthesis
MMAIMIMRLLRIPYYINIDGEAFLDGTGLKSRMKRFMIRGARGYLAAGERSAAALKKVVGDKPVIPYYFSSLDETELQVNGAEAFRQRSEAVLIVGQYMDYKGLDVALRVAQMDPKRTYKFVGMGNRTELFVREHQPDKLDNVQIIPFLQKDYLQQEYRSCAAMLLPSRQECWGLVVNEAASFGMPIVSTWGSGAAVEFLSQEYPKYLAEPGNEIDLNNKLQALLEDDNIEEYQSFLLEKSKQYSIERCVLAHLNAFDIH